MRRYMCREPSMRHFLHLTPSTHINFTQTPVHTHLNIEHLTHKGLALVHSERHGSGGGGGVGQEWGVFWGHKGQFFSFFLIEIVLKRARIFWTHFGRTPPPPCLWLPKFQMPIWNAFYFICSSKNINCEC